MALQTHTQGCLLSEAFPRCCATKLHTSMGGRSEGGVDGSTEGWRVSASSAAYTHCRDNCNMYWGGGAFRLARADVSPDMPARQAEQQEADRAAEINRHPERRQAKPAHVSLFHTSPPTPALLFWNISLLSLSLLCLHPHPPPTSQPRALT